ncbi:MAG: hypothetical protein KDD04_10515, partial [Sinomicrobium sp.]|nr:hypothetical protein [Sinomicrobium sp.]
MLLTSPFVFSQQIRLKGSVTVHNSKYETGKIQYVKDAFVTAPFSKPSGTDDKGTFALEFVGIKPGTA